MTDALIVVDVQNDFITGSLAVEGGNEVARAISSFIDDEAHPYDFTVATQDWHIRPGEHFSDTPDYIDSWPPHCVAWSYGAMIHGALRIDQFDENFLKGRYFAAYSGFEGSGLDSGDMLATWLIDKGVRAVDVVGIATDYCVKATALDAVKMGFKTRVLADLCAPVTAEGGAAALEEMAAAGVEIVR